MISYKFITKLIQLHNIHNEHNDQVNKLKKLHEQIKANIFYIKIWCKVKII